MKKQTLILIAAGLILSFPVNAVADEGTEFKLQHPYIQLGAGGSIRKDDNYVTLKLAGGVGFNKYLGVEAGYTAITDIFFADVDFLYLSLVAKYPISEKTTLAGKLGVSRWDSTTQVFSLQPGDDHGVNGMLGVDFQCDLLKNVAIVLSLEYYGSVNVGKISGDESILPGTIGVRYTF